MAHARGGGNSPLLSTTPLAQKCRGGRGAGGGGVGAGGGGGGGGGGGPPPRVLHCQSHGVLDFFSGMDFLF
jgi:hypothetical protein